MSLLLFLLACGTGAVLGLAARPSHRIGRLAGLAGLLVAFGAALFIGSKTNVTIGDVTLAGSEYSGLFLACATGSGLLLFMVALASGWPDELAPAALAAFAGLAVATTATDAGVALAAGAAAATAGALVILRTTPPNHDTDGRLAEIRTIGLVVVGLLFAAIAVLRPAWTGAGDSPVFVLAFLGVGLALAVRSGAVPFHVPAARLRHSGSPLASALLLVWIPAGLGLLGVGWSAITFGIRNDWLNAAVALVQVVAVATLVLGALAAMVHDELEEIAAYSIVADAGFVLLALAARTDAAAEPARFWLLTFVAAKTGLVAWAAAVSRAYGTSNLGRLHGWVRRTPLLGLALVVIAVATIGWPGGAIYRARSTLIRLALPGQLQFLFVGSILLSIAYYGRLLVFGLLSPSDDVKAARSERPRWAAGLARPMIAPSQADASPGQPSSVAGTSAATATASPKDDTTAADGVPARKKPRASRAAAAALNPTTTATVAATAGLGAVAAAAAGADAAPGPPPAPVSAADHQPGDGTRKRLAVAWGANRTLEVSLVVLGGAALAVALAFGGLGATDASQFGIPLDAAARATATPAHAPATPASTSTPRPTLAPRPTGGASGSAGPSGSALPSGSPSPVKTAAPARGNTD